jgi:hypothetical protein
MPYYQGDYYRGGFFGSLFKGIGKLAGGFLGLGGGGGGGKTIIERYLPAAPAAAGGALTAVEDVGQALVRKGGAAMQAGTKFVRGHPVLSAAGAAGILAGGATLAHARGVHPAVAAALGGGRRHRMNVCNPRALRRAIRRTHGFAKLAMKTIHLIHPKKKVRFGGFRKRRKKA